LARDAGKSLLEESEGKALRGTATDHSKTSVASNVAFRLSKGILGIRRLMTMGCAKSALYRNQRGRFDPASFFLYRIPDTYNNCFAPLDW